MASSDSSAADMDAVSSVIDDTSEIQPHEGTDVTTTAAAAAATVVAVTAPFVCPVIVAACLCLMLSKNQMDTCPSCVHNCVCEKHGPDICRATEHECCCETLCSKSLAITKPGELTQNYKKILKKCRAGEKHHLYQNIYEPEPGKYHDCVCRLHPHRGPKVTVCRHTAKECACSCIISLKWCRRGRHRRHQCVCESGTGMCFAADKNVVASGTYHKCICGQQWQGFTPKCKSYPHNCVCRHADIECHACILDHECVCDLHPSKQCRVIPTDEEVRDHYTRRQFKKHHKKYTSLEHKCICNDSDNPKPCIAKNHNCSCKIHSPDNCKMDPKLEHDCLCPQGTTDPHCLHPHSCTCRGEWEYDCLAKTHKQFKTGCPVCLVQYDILRIEELPCRHRVCRKCYRKLEKCPLCRKVFSKET